MEVLARLVVDQAGFAGKCGMIGPQYPESADDHRVALESCLAIPGLEHQDGPEPVFPVTPTGKMFVPGFANWGRIEQAMSLQ